MRGKSGGSVARSRALPVCFRWWVWIPGPCGIGFAGMSSVRPARTAYPTSPPHPPGSAVAYLLDCVSVATAPSPLPRRTSWAWIPLGGSGVLGGPQPSRLVAPAVLLRGTPRGTIDGTDVRALDCPQRGPYLPSPDCYSCSPVWLLRVSRARAGCTYYSHPRIPTTRGGYWVSGYPYTPVPAYSYSCVFCYRG